MENIEMKPKFIYNFKFQCWLAVNSLALNYINDINGWKKEKLS